MKKYQIWVEGYRGNVNSGNAEFMGSFYGRSLKDAVSNWADYITDENLKKCIDVEKLTFWKSRIFDNQEQAIKSFG